MITFGNKTQTEAVIALLEKYKDEPCMNTTVGEVLKDLGGEDWNRDKELRKWLKEKLGELLENIGYWDFVYVPEVPLIPLEEIEAEKKKEEMNKTF